MTLQLTQCGTEEALVGWEAEDVRVDNLPAVVVLVQLVCLVVSQVVPGKVVAQYPQLGRGARVRRGGVHV